jgi:hypothetical protein
VDLHARCMYLCILDQSGQALLHENFPADGTTSPLSIPSPSSGRRTLEGSWRWSGGA